MKRQFTIFWGIIASICITLTMIIGVCGVSASAAEGESTLSLSLIGDSTIYLQKGTEYREFGATAYDTVEGDLTESITIKNSVRKDTVGTYTVSYSVSNASSQTATASRTVIVIEDMKNEMMVYKSSSYTGTTNNFKKVIELSDGGILAVGAIRQRFNYYSQLNAIVVKYDSNLQEQWTQTFSYDNYDSVVDIIEDDIGNILIFGRGSSANFLSIINKDGEILNNRYNFGSGDFYCTTEVAENKYAVCRPDSINKIVYLTVNDDYTVSKEETTINAKIGYAFLADGNVYSLYGGEFTKITLETGETKSIKLNNGNESRAMTVVNSMMQQFLITEKTDGKE